MNETLFQNERGAVNVLRAVMLSLAKALPQAAAAGVADAARFRDLAVSSKQPDAFLAGMDQEIALWKQRLGLDADKG